jgi:cell division protein FtsB
VVLLLVLAALVMTLALPLREYVQQRSQIRALEREMQVRQERVDALTNEQRQWNDPTFVELQARQRLHYVYPGETGYVVLSPQDVQEAKQPEVRVATKERQAWYDTVWSSVQAADARG